MICKRDQRVRYSKTLSSACRSTFVQARLLWEQRISAKWEAYWAMRRPKAEEVPIAKTTSLEKHPDTTKGEPNFPARLSSRIHGDAVALTTTATTLCHLPQHQLFEIDENSV